MCAVPIVGQNTHKAFCVLFCFIFWLLFCWKKKRTKNKTSKSNEPKWELRYVFETAKPCKVLPFSSLLSSLLFFSSLFCVWLIDRVCWISSWLTLPCSPRESILVGLQRHSSIARRLSQRKRRMVAAVQFFGNTSTTLAILSCVAAKTKVIDFLEIQWQSIGTWPTPSPIWPLRGADQVTELSESLVLDLGECGCWCTAFWTIGKISTQAVSVCVFHRIPLRTYCMRSYFFWSCLE